MFGFCIYAIFLMLWWFGMFYLWPSLGWWLRDRQTPHPHPGGQVVAEKGVGVKRKPIWLYTHPHSISLDTQGVGKNGYPMENRYHVLKTKRKAVNLDGEESDSKKRNL